MLGLVSVMRNIWEQVLMKSHEVFHNFTLGEGETMKEETDRQQFHQQLGYSTPAMEIQPDSDQVVTSASNLTTANPSRLHRSITAEFRKGVSSDKE